MSHETTALVLREVNGPFTLETIKVDTLKPHEALIEIQAVGLCHTDLSCATGILPAVTPAVFGHEGKSRSYRVSICSSYLFQVPEW
jgi:Zn-dependent alcohol dehydrogenase